MEKSLQELETIVSKFSGDPAFVELAVYYREKGELEKALLVCLRGIEANPSELKGRLQVSRIYYELGLNSFAKKELTELSKELPKNNNIKKLLQLFSVVPAKNDIKSGSSKIIAEAEFDLDLTKKD